MSSSYFDLVIRLKTEAEHQFRNIQRSEYHTLFNFFTAKKLKILNLGQAQPGAAGPSFRGLAGEDRAQDPYLNQIAGGDESSDEEVDFASEFKYFVDFELIFGISQDDDFVIGEKDDGGSPTDGSEEEDSGDDGNASKDVSLEAEKEEEDEEDEGEEDEEEVNFLFWR